jgi:predicted phage tail protein
VASTGAKTGRTGRLLGKAAVGLAAITFAGPVPPAAATATRSLAASTLCGPDGFTAAATPGDGDVTLSWCQPPVNPDASYSYEVYEGTTPDGESEAPINNSPIQTTSYDVTGLADGTPYYFIVEAVETANGEPVTTLNSKEVQATPAPAISAPGAPTGLGATPGDSLVHLSWVTPDSDGGSPITEYHIWEGTTPRGETGPPVAISAGTSGTVSGLADGTTYYFVITAVNADGDGSWSNEASAIPAAAPPLSSPPPSSPPPSSPPPSSPPVSSQPASSPAVHHRHDNHSASTAGPAWWLVILLSFAGVAVAGVALAVRRLSTRGSSGPPPRTPDVRVERHVGAPGKMAVRSTGSRPTISVRIEPQTGARTTTVEETLR